MNKRLIYAAGFLLLTAFSGSAQTAAFLDHFNCYFAPAPLQSQFLWLQDQFDVRRNEVESIYDLRMELFCNPAKKTLIGSTVVPAIPIAHADAHLAWYRLSPQPSIPRLVPISNQFGPQTLETGEAEFLAVPSGKQPIAATVPAQFPPIPPQGELDHFKCYSATGPSIGKTVLLNDQFFTSDRTEVAAVLQPRFFCNPVQKTTLNPQGCGPGVPCPTVNTPINPNPNHQPDHLTCYLTSTRSTFSGVVFYNNQFVPPGTAPTVALKNPVLLCVPTTKSEDWQEIPPGSTVGSGPGRRLLTSHS